jgi:hypothetical protein
MVIQQRIQNGLTLAANSFLMLWHHKKLLVYLLIPVLVNLKFGVHSAYDFVYALIGRGAPDSIMPVLKSMAKAISADIGIACLSVHTFSFLEHQISSVRATVATVFHRAPVIITWSLLSGSIIYLTLSGLHILHNYCDGIGLTYYMNSLGITINPADVLQMILGLLWIIKVFFMIQILALEELSLIESFKASWALSHARLLEIIGGEFWIGLIWFLSMLPFMIIFEKPMAYHLLENERIHEWSWIHIFALIIIGWICASAQAVFRTKLYHHYDIQPREEEVDIMFYPRF